MRTLHWFFVAAATERARARVSVSPVSIRAATVTFPHRSAAALCSLPAERSEPKCHDDLSCGRAHRCGGEAKLGALEPGTAPGRPGDPLWFYSRLRCGCAWGGAGIPVLRLSRHGIAALRPGHRHRHLVRGGWAFRAGGGSILGLLQLLLHRASLQLRSFQQKIYRTFFFSSAWAAIVAWFVSCSAPHRERSSRTPATTCRLRWKAQAPRGRNSQTQSESSSSGLASSKRATTNWNLLPIPSPTTFARRFAMWSGTRSCFRDRRLARSTRRVVGSCKRSSNCQKEWVT